MRTSNPMISDRALERMDVSLGGRMTVNGTVNKAFLMLILLVAGAGWTWFQVRAGMEGVLGLGMIGGIGGLVIAIATAFRPAWARYTAVVYAVLEGLFVGAISALYETRYPGIVMQAVAVTFVTFFAMLAAYKFGWIKVTQTFRNVVVAATLALGTFYLLAFALSFFNVSMPIITNTGLFGIGFSVFAAGLAALNLVLDFDFIEAGEAEGFPAFMEWYGAFTLTVTLVWLYIELLRLLGKLRR